MPRTKQVRKKSSVVKRSKQSTLISGPNLPVSNDAVVALVSGNYNSTERFYQDFNIYYSKIIQDHQQGYEKACDQVRKMFSDILKDLPDSIKLLNVNNDMNESLVEDQNKDPNIVSGPKMRQPRARQPADDVDFKKPKTPRLGSSRSSSRKRSVSTLATPKTHADRFKTPLMSSRKLLATGMTIAPKISDKPMCVMRRPVQGEMAISMSGSPLMVSAVSTEDIPTVNVPLQDGRIISIMPEAGAPPIDFPGFDETTKKYLKTLRAHLEILAPNSP